MLRRLLLSDANSQFEAGESIGVGMGCHHSLDCRTDGKQSRWVGLPQGVGGWLFCQNCASVGLLLMPAMTVPAMFTLVWLAAWHPRNMAV